MEAESLTNLLNQHSEVLTTWSIALLLLLIGLALVWPRIRSGYRDRCLQKKIRSVGVDVLHKVVLPDGMDGAVYLENLLLTPDGLLILPVHRYQGALFAAEGIDNWTQVIGNRTFKFSNPLPQLESEMLAVRDYVADVPVDGMVVFTSGVEFPKGRPDRLVPVDELDGLAEQNRQRPVPPAYWQSWKELRQRIQAPEVSALRAQYAIDDKPTKDSRVLPGVLLLIIAIGWLGWRYSLG